jgi:hypothetical protein
MFCRPKFITNSSSTSFLAFGVWVDKHDFNKASEPPPGCEDYWPPFEDEVCVTIGFPSVKIKDDGTLEYPDPSCLQDRYRALKQWLVDNNIPGEIGLCEGSWYDG